MLLLSSDLSSGTISSLKSALEKDAEDCVALNGALDSFIGVIGDKEKLSGVSYDAVRSKLQSYKDIVNKRQEAARNLSNAISTAVQSMTSYIEGYSKLDDSELDATRQTYNNVINEINNITNTANDLLTDAQRSSLPGLRSEAERLKKLIEKLEGLAPADGAAFGNVSGAEASISGLSSSVGGMAPIQVNYTV